MRWQHAHTDDDLEPQSVGDACPSSSDHSNDSLPRTELAGQTMYKLKHRVSCHRCGNMRKNRRECSRCPHVYCHQCEVKMVEEFGPNIFKDGCPVCKEKCCCGKNRSFTCPRQHHCYKKCPSTKRHSYKTANGFVTASKRCMKNTYAFKELIASRPGSADSGEDADDTSCEGAKHDFFKSDTPQEGVRRSARISSLQTKTRRIACYAEDSSSDLSDHEHDSEGETSCGGSDQDSSVDTDAHIKGLKRTSSCEDMPAVQIQPRKSMRASPRSAATPYEASYMPKNSYHRSPKSRRGYSPQVVHVPMQQPQQSQQLFQQQQQQQPMEFVQPAYYQNVVVKSEPVVKEEQPYVNHNGSNYNVPLADKDINDITNLLDIDMTGLFERSFFEGVDDRAFDFESKWLQDIF